MWLLNKEGVGLLNDELFCYVCLILLIQCLYVWDMVFCMGMGYFQLFANVVMMLKGDVYSVAYLGTVRPGGTFLA